MVAGHGACVGAYSGTHLLVLIFPCVGNPNVLNEVQELQMEEQQEKVYIPGGCRANASAGISCTCCNNIVVPADVYSLVQKEGLRTVMSLSFANHIPVSMF